MTLPNRTLVARSLFIKLTPLRNCVNLHRHVLTKQLTSGFYLRSLLAIIVSYDHRFGSHKNHQSRVPSFAL